ncbi:hypothetical protein D3C84_1061460 [compost metagenome]
MQAGLKFAVGGFELLPVALVFEAQGRAVEGTAHRMLEDGQVFQGFDQVVRRAKAQGFDRVAHHASAGNHYHRGF